MATSWRSTRSSTSVAADVRHDSRTSPSTSRTSSTATAATCRDHVRSAITSGQRPRPDFWNPTGRSSRPPSPRSPACSPRHAGRLPAQERVIVRRERPHPGAQLDLIEQADGYRYTALATDTRAGQHAFLDARHRAHARVEDRIRTGRDTGLGRLPSRSFAINSAWLTAVMIAVDLLPSPQPLLLPAPGPPRADPKPLRYRLLHVAARLPRGHRRRCPGSPSPAPGRVNPRRRSPASPHYPS